MHRGGFASRVPELSYCAHPLHSEFHQIHQYSYLTPRLSINHSYIFMGQFTSLWYLISMLYFFTKLHQKYAFTSQQCVKLKTADCRTNWTLFRSYECNNRPTTDCNIILLNLNISFALKIYQHYRLKTSTVVCVWLVIKTIIIWMTKLL